MKTRLALLLLGVSVATALRAQVPAAVQYAPGSLDQLVAPIALYPDSLVALILPASSASTDLVLAARFLEQGGTPAQADAQPWATSVRALAHYPEVLTWMDSNLAWTQALGQAYALQPEAVMQAVQAMRAKALAAGTLQSNAQQQVVVADGAIEILPAQPDVIYVPSYDWTVVYDTAPVWDYPLITFRFCYPVGPWLNFDCDWREHRIWSHGWRNDRDDRRDWADHRDFGNRRDPGLRATGRFPVADHGTPPPADRRFPNSPRPDARPGTWHNPPAIVNNSQPHRAVDSPPRAPAAHPNFPVVNNPPRGPRPDEVRAFPRAPIPNRPPPVGFAQSSPPRSFGGHEGGSRPSFSAPAPRFSAPAAASAPRQASSGGDNSRSQGRTQAR